MVNSSPVVTLYVNPATGNDTATGSRLAPLKTLKRALKLIKAPKTIIQLAPGYYNAASGESFPLLIPNGVMVLGNEATKGQGVVISGNGEYRSESFGVQNITILLLGDAQIMGVSVSNNSTAKGTGVWVESGASTLANNTFISCSREGLFISGNAKPAITDNLFIQNAAGGLVMARNSKGEVLRNIFQKNSIGIAISDFSAPLVVSNQIKQNTIGIALSRETRPVLRNNLLEKNSQGGLLVNGKAMPDLGSSQDPAGNIFRENEDYDVQNLTQEKLVAVGNQLNPASSVGLIDFIAATEDLQRQVANNSNMFPDLGGHWAITFVEALVSKGLISGFPDGTFKPDAPMTRAQYAAVIAKTFQLSETNNRNFTDVKSDFWAAPAINRAATAGFISGFPDGSFRPSQNLTKIQAIVSIVNGLKLAGANPNVLSVYIDRAQIPSFATDAVAVATQKLLVLNYPQVELLEPLKDITRAEVATLLYQALVNNGKEKAIASPYIVNPDADIPSYLDLTGHWAEPFIRALVSMNLSKGFEDGTYQPDKPMTRAQYAVLVTNAFNPTPKRPSPKFSDVKSDFWAYSSIQQAASAGFVGGFNDGTFRPQQNVQRLQVIVSLVNGLALPTAHNSAINCYSDRNTIPDYARTAVATATNQSIIVNYPDPKQIQPSRSATRGEVAAMVYQALVATKRTSAINSPYVVSLPITYQ
ncbi:MAG: S-layer homology domain-containing protein [Scytonematopsis contorta HA4267-MV1]|jgi:parallel beta-helix repeat protein|nr:S-layer homology domain-containing protein [Scytonematopsis contorta HA4267-MV1]